MNGKQLLLMLCMGISFGNVHAMLRPALGPVKRAVAQQAFARRALSSNNLGSSSCRYKEGRVWGAMGYGAGLGVGATILIEVFDIHGYKTARENVKQLTMDMVQVQETLNKLEKAIAVQNATKHSDKK